MPTLNQLIRHGREEKRRTDHTRTLDQCPKKQGVRPRLSTRTPKKSNSAPRKIAKVRLSRLSTRTPKKSNLAPCKIAKVRLSNRHYIFAGTFYGLNKRR